MQPIPLEVLNCGFSCVKRDPIGDVRLSLDHAQAIDANIASMMYNGGIYGVSWGPDATHCRWRNSGLMTDLIWTVLLWPLSEGYNVNRTRRSHGSLGNELSVPLAGLPRPQTSVDKMSFLWQSIQCMKI